MTRFATKIHRVASSERGVVENPPHSEGVPPAWETRFLVAFFLAALAVVLLRCAWVGDDAYVTFRVADNLVNGYGPTWNPAERVQAFTNPLWMLLMSGLLAVTGEVYYTSILFSLLVSLGAAYLIVARHAARWPAMAVVATLLLFSKAFVDYSTSGLESPLTHLLLALFFWIYFQGKPSRRRLFWMSLCAAATAWNRLDTSLLFLPVLVYELWKLRSWRALGAMALGLTPLFAWEIFAVVYYGFPFPNTAYAKLGTGITRGDLIHQGILYLVDSVSRDPVTLLAVVGAGWSATMRRDRSSVLAIGGVTMYLCYVVLVGGDFMSGRFLTGCFVVSVVVLARNLSELSWRRWVPIQVLVVLAGFAAPHPPPLSSADFGASAQGPAASVGPHGIADERAYYYPTTGLLRARRDVQMPGHQWAETGRQLRRHRVKVYITGAIGFVGYFAGPATHIVDPHGLAEPFLARLPSLEDKHWRIGHFARRIPEGYLETLTSGHNRIKDRRLAAYYDKVARVVRGEIFSWDRFATMFHLNFGGYGDWVDVAELRHNPLIRASARSLARPRPREGTSWDAPGTLRFYQKGLAVALGSVRHDRTIEVSLDRGDVYGFLFLRGEAKLAALQVALPGPHGSGLTTQRIGVPEAAKRAGYDGILIKPLSGDDRYSIGHLRLVESLGHRRRPGG